MRFIKFLELSRGTPVYINPDSVVYVMHGAAFEPSKIAGQPAREIPGVVLQLFGNTVGVKGTIAEVIEQLEAPDWGDVPE